MTASARVALVVIARDEAPRIQRLLHSVATWVDTTWVLDTGSTDDTPALAAACGAGWNTSPGAMTSLPLATPHWPWPPPTGIGCWTLTNGSSMAALRCAH